MTLLVWNLIINIIGQIEKQTIITKTENKKSKTVFFLLQIERNNNFFL